MIKAYFEKEKIFFKCLLRFEYLAPSLKVNKSFCYSEWYQLRNRASPQLETIQHHMVMWSVDTLPQLFEVITFR